MPTDKYKQKASKRRLSLEKINVLAEGRNNLTDTYIHLENKPVNMSKMFDPFLHQSYQVSNNDPINVLLRTRENSFQIYFC